MRARRLVLTLLLALPLATFAQGPRFLPDDPGAFLSVLAAPPADDSAEGRADLEIVLKNQATRTSEQIARAEEINDQTAFAFARAALGDWIKAKKFPATKAIFKELDQEAEAVINLAKDHWKRKRPYLRDPRVIPSGKHSATGSYPSGHSADAAMWGVVWTAILPQKAREFQAQVRAVMQSRVLRGVHYPSDTEAGKTLGEAMGRAFLKSPAGQAAVATMRAEFAASKRAAKAGLVP